MPVKRLLARNCGDMALLPAVVVQDELHSGSLQLYTEAPNIAELFDAVILAKRSLQAPNSPLGLTMECFRGDRYWPILLKTPSTIAFAESTWLTLKSGS